MSLKYHQVSKDPKSLKVKTISLANAKDKSSPHHASKFDSFDSSLKNPSSSNDLLSNIFSFNSSVGKAIQLCLQNQANITQILLDLVHNTDEEKSVESYIPSHKHHAQHREKSKIFDDSYFQDTISFHLGSSKDKGAPSLAYRLESLINDITSVLKPPPPVQPVQPLQPIKHEPNVQIPATTTAHIHTKDRQKENSPPKVVAPGKWKQEQKRTSVPHLAHNMKNNEFYFPKKKVHTRKNSNMVDDRRILTDSFLNKTALAPLDLTNQSRDERDMSKKYDTSLMIADNKTPKVTLKLTSPKNFIESRERSRDKIKASPSPKNEHRFHNLAQYLKEIPSNRDTPKGSTMSKALKQGAPEKVPERMMERRGSERGPTMTSYFNPKPMIQGEDNQEIIEETLIDNFMERQPESTALATLIDDTERVLQPAELNDSDTPMGMLNGASIGPLMEKRVIKAMLQDENEMMMRGSGLENLCEKKNLISAKWYRSWKEYVNFDSELENFGITQHIGTYSKPGRITNRHLLKYDVVEDLGSLTGDLELREHLLEHHDYEVLSRKVFSVLTRWYGCDFEIARGMKEDPFKKNKFYLDLYPEEYDMMRNNRGMKPREVSPNNGPYGGQGEMMRTGKIINNIIQTNLINNGHGHGQIKKKSGGRYDQC